MKDVEITHYCSFCGKSNVEAKAIITSDSVCICDECILSCVNLIFTQALKNQDDKTTKK